MQYYLPTRDPAVSPYFVEVPNYINKLQEVQSSLQFTLPNNYRNLTLERKLDVIQDLQTLLDTTYQQLNLQEWKAITLHFIGAQAIILCIKLPPDALVRQAPEFLGDYEDDVSRVFWSLLE